MCFFITKFCFSPIIEYRWKTSEWTECTRTCGGGSRNRTVTCVQVTTPLTSSYTAQPDRATEVEVNETMCRCNTWAIKPTSRELCNTEMCPIWKAGEFSEVYTLHSIIALQPHSFNYHCIIVQCDLWNRNTSQRSYMQ